MTVDEKGPKQATRKRPRKMASAASNVDIPSPPSTPADQNGTNVTPPKLPFTKVAGGSLGKHPALFSADSTHFIMSNSNSIHVYHASTSLVFRVIPPPPDRGEFCISSLVRNPQNPHEIYSATTDGHIDLWNFTTGELLKSWKVDGKIDAIRVHPNYADTAFVVATRPGKHIQTQSTSSSNETSNIEQKMVTSLLRVPLLKSANIDDKAQKLAKNLKKFISMDMSDCGTYIVIGLVCEFIIVNVKDKTSLRHKLHDADMSCLAIHPTEPIIAVGDVDGKITLWYCLHDDRSNKPTTSILHWHAHAVHTIAFSKDGVTMLSGGEEAVLVIWQLPTRNATFLPRLGSELLQISISPDNLSYAITQGGNMVRVLSAVDLKTQQAVTGLRVGRCKGKVPTGLVVEPRNKLIALNALPGSLQFISSSTFEHVMELEVTPGNRVSRRDNNDIVRAHVLYVAFSADGEWMVTLESRESGPHEQHLKFWKYDGATQSYSVNTRVDGPHDSGSVLSLKMNTNPGTPSTCITTGDDNKFRLWGPSLSEEDDVRWSCKFVGMYKSEKTTDACISSDGSLIAVAEQHVVTLWDSSSFTLQGVLNCSFPSKVHYVALATNSHYLYASTPTRLLVWNLLTCTVWWSVPIYTKLFVADPYTSRLLVSENFKKGSRLTLFEPESSTPLAVHVMRTRCVAATFLSGTSNVLVMDTMCNLFLWGSESVDKSKPSQLDPAPTRPTSLLDNLFGASSITTPVSTSNTEGRNLPIISAIPPLAFLEGKPSHQLPAPRQLISSLMDLLLLPATSIPKLPSNDGCGV
ncbi:hypothetical protein SeMB42_g03970 [Synchytrium endobioticum]|uniref:WD repeat-containing protein 75 second beta-propeller domain-containing protein n=1 Tax=Synchytrium endobioticum TaxID=286115 RepID=A0A507DKQ3_9FUNG|nr:hypothetical protein SeMB42_g03970 [Synchytrium endobioticum]TPX51460.1 hypothetical protein SeLEV6574_g00275 [Synchytrium endobioticum]